MSVFLCDDNNHVVCTIFMLNFNVPFFFCVGEQNNVRIKCVDQSDVLSHVTSLQESRLFYFHFTLDGFTILRDVRYFFRLYAESLGCC